MRFIVKATVKGLCCRLCVSVIAESRKRAIKAALEHFAKDSPPPPINGYSCELWDAIANPYDWDHTYAIQAT